MKWLESFARDVGNLTKDETLVRGVLTIGAGLFVVSSTMWRFLRGTSKPKDRVIFNAPNDVEINVKPVDRNTF